MIIYYEQKSQSYPLTQEILRKFPHTEKVAIHHYKNLFDKTIDYPTEPCILLAKQEKISILKTPDNYGYPGTSFFFKPSLNCVFDCNYCYLKGSFKNHFPVIFVNYEEMQTEIAQTIDQERKNWNKNQITFYASNYSDLLAIEHLTSFHQHFIPFFEQFDDKVLMESRTKSANIESLLKLSQQKEKIKNTEIAFSISPQFIANQYEKGSASLEQKLKAIQELLSLWYRVWIRFLPLLPIENYLNLYQELTKNIKEVININEISSIFIAPLIYNKEDYHILKKKNPEYRFLEPLQENEKGLMKMDQKYYKEFRNLFTTAFPKQNIFRDYQ